MKKTLILGIICAIFIVSIVTGIIFSQNNREDNMLDASGNEINSEENITSGDDLPKDDKETEFALISNNSKLVLGSVITEFTKEPISITKDGGDGYVLDNIIYDDIQIRIVKNTGNDIHPILDMTTTSNNYKTPRGIKVGDNVKILKETYPEFLEKGFHDEWGNYYLFDPEDDIGFYKILFYIENEVIIKILVFDGIDG